MTLKLLGAVGCAIVGAQVAAEVAGVEVQERRSWGDGFELLSGVVRYEIDPRARAARDVADIRLAPRNARGLVEYSGPFLVIRPADPTKRNGVTLFEVANRGNEQSNGFFYDKQGFSLTSPGAGKGGRPGVLARGYTLAWAGWQGRLRPDQFGLTVPTGTGTGSVRFDFTAGDAAAGTANKAERLDYCARAVDQRGATLRTIVRFDDPGTVVPSAAWRFATLKDGQPVADPCHVLLVTPPAAPRVYVLTYDAEPAAVMGLGQAAVRDFVAHLKHRDLTSPLNDTPTRIIGYGYSQSGRFLRDFLYRGFNRDAAGRLAFDGMLIYAAGAGRGSFNHRYALPGAAGNAVGSDLRAVDLYPFADTATPDIGRRGRAGLLDRARRDGTSPKIFTVFSGSEYWARAGSLVQTSADGRRAVALDPDNRLYHFVGTPHGPRRPARFRTEGTKATYPYNYSFDVGFSAGALLEHMRRWLIDGTPPPPSVAPSLGTTLVAASALRVPLMTPPPSPPPVWQLDLGRRYARRGIIGEPPKIGARYPLLVPAVDADGNEVAGIKGVVARVPLGTYTAWNYTNPVLRPFGYLSGLQGSFVPFARTRAERERAGDPRPSIEERYGDEEGWRRAVERAITAAIADGILLPDDRDHVTAAMRDTWKYVQDVRDGVVPPPLASPG